MADDKFDINPANENYESIFDDFEISPNIKGRKPAGRSKENLKYILSQTAKGMVEGIGESVSKKIPSVGTINREIASGLSEAANMRNDILREMIPIVKDIRMTSQKALPLTKSIMPKKIYDALEKTLGSLDRDMDSKSSKEIKDEQENRIITEALNNIFKKQQALSESETELQTINRIIDTTTQKIRFNKTMEVYTGIYKELRFQSKYMTNTFTAFMKKKLELDYRQLFISQDILGAIKTVIKITDTKLEEIKHNASLPEVSKKTKFDLVKETGQKRLASRFTDFVTDYGKNVFKTIKNTFSDKILSGTKQASNMSNALLNAIESLQQTEEGKETLKKYGGGAIGELIGSQGAKGVTGYLINKNKKFKEMLGDPTTNLKERATLGLSNKRDEWLSEGNMFQKMMAAFIPKKEYANLLIKNDLLSQGNEAVSFDKFTRQSIVEIIPGYLAKITKNTLDLVTGKINEEEVYDVTSRKFSPVSEVRENIFKEAFGSPKARGVSNIQAAGILKGAITAKAGQKGKDQFEALEGDIRTLLMNHSANEKMLQVKDLKAFLDNEKYNKRYIDTITENVKNPKAAIPLLYTSLLKPTGDVDNNIVKDIDNNIINMMKAEKYKEVLPKLLDDMGYSRYFSDITSDKGVIGTKHIVKEQLKADKEFKDIILNRQATVTEEKVTKRDEKQIQKIERKKSGFINRHIISISTKLSSKNIPFLSKAFSSLLENKVSEDELIKFEDILNTVKTEELIKNDIYKEIPKTVEKQNIGLISTINEDLLEVISEASDTLDKSIKENVEFATDMITDSILESNQILSAIAKQIASGINNGKSEVDKSEVEVPEETEKSPGFIKRSGKFAGKAAVKTGKAYLDLYKTIFSKGAPMVGKAALGAGIGIGGLGVGAGIGAGMLGKAYLNLYGKAGKKIYNSTASLFNKKGARSEPFVDIYLKDNINSKGLLLTRRKQQQGVVFESGTQVERSSDIHEPVFDPETRQCLITKEDIEKGLVTVDNAPLGSGMFDTATKGKFGKIFKKGIKGTGKGLLGLAGFGGEAFTGYLDIYKNIAGMGKEGIKALGGLVGGLFGGGKASNKKIDSILEKMDTIIKIIKDNGPRKGSYDEYQEELDEKKSPLDKAKEMIIDIKDGKKKKGLLGKVTSSLSEKFGLSNVKGFLGPMLKGALPLLGPALAISATAAASWYAGSKIYDKFIGPLLDKTFDKWNKDAEKRADKVKEDTDKKLEEEGKKIGVDVKAGKHAGSFTKTDYSNLLEETNGVLSKDQLEEIKKFETKKTLVDTLKHLTQYADITDKNTEKITELIDKGEITSGKEMYDWLMKNNYSSSWWNLGLVDSQDKATAKKFLLDEKMGVNAQVEAKMRGLDKQAALSKIDKGTATKSNITKSPTATIPVLSNSVDVSQPSSSSVNVDTNVWKEVNKGKIEFNDIATTNNLLKSSPSYNKLKDKESELIMEPGDEGSVYKVVQDGNNIIIYAKRSMLEQQLEQPESTVGKEAYAAVSAMSTPNINAGGVNKTIEPRTTFKPEHQNEDLTSEAINKTPDVIKETGDKQVNAINALGMQLNTLIEQFTNVQKNTSNLNDINKNLKNAKGQTNLNMMANNSRQAKESISAILNNKVTPYPEPA